MKKIVCNWAVAVLLCIALFLGLLPAVNALDTEEIQSETDTVICEIVDLREECVKHFDMGDGTRKAVHYGRPVHRLDNNGKWQDINNSLSLTSTKGIQAYTSLDQRTSFAPAYTAGQPLVTLNENGTSVSLNLIANSSNSGLVAMSVGNTSSTAVVTNPEPLQTMSVSDNFDPGGAVYSAVSVMYENVLPDTDIEYVLDGNDVKENIIINAKADSYSYRFLLDLDGLYPAMLDCGTVVLYNSVSNEECYQIPAPFMYDANDILSEAVTYQLTESSGQYYLTVTADAQWINAEERVFPVVIDPTIQGTTVFHDTFITSAYPTNNYGYYSRLWVTRSPSMYATAKTYLRPYLPTLPYGSSVTAAEIHISYYYNDYCKSNWMLINGHYLTSEWEEGSLTWNSASQKTNYGMATSVFGSDYAFGAVGKYSSPGELVYRPSASTVNNWYAGVNYYGIGLVDAGASHGENYSVILCSYEETNNSYRPYIEVSYVTPVKLESGVYWLKNANNAKYMTTHAGGVFAGTALEQNTKDTSAENIRNQLYKVEYLTSDDGKYCYSVRPLTNCLMGLSGTASGEATIQTDPTASNQRWYISQSGDYFTIQNKTLGSSGYLSAPESTTNGVELTFTTGTDLRSKWVFEEYTGDTLEGIYWVKGPDILRTNHAADYEAVVYSTTLGLDEDLVYSVTDTDGLDTSLATIDSSTGNLTAGGNSGYVWVAARCGTSGLQTDRLVQIGGTYRCTLTHYYDQGFLIKNSTETPGKSRDDLIKEKLRSYHEAIADILFEEYGLEVIGVYKAYNELGVNSPGDQCKMLQYDLENIGDLTYDHLNSDCPHSDFHLSGEDYTNGLYQDANVSGAQANNFYVVWTGHLLTDETGGIPQAKYELRTCVITPYSMTTGSASEGYTEESDKDKEDFWSYALLHEFAHLLGTVDQYCFNDQEDKCSNVECAQCNQKESVGCVMTSLGDIVNVNSDNAFCTPCDNKIQNTMDLALINEELS